MIKIIGISGSANPESYTLRALRVAMRRAEELAHGAELVDLRDFRLPLPGAPATGRPEDVARLQGLVKDAQGIILATPEYHGSYSSGMKLLIDNLGFPSMLRGKAVSLLGVAAGRIGAIKALEHLASVCAHVGALVVPGPISIAQVQEEFDAKGAVKNPATRKLLENVAEGLVAYLHHHVCPGLYLETLVRDGVIPEAPSFSPKRK